jgi:hypothetical protein
MSMFKAIYFCDVQKRDFNVDAHMHMDSLQFSISLNFSLLYSMRTGTQQQNI